MKRIIWIWALILSVCDIKAQTLVIDQEGEPMIGTVAMDNDGDPIGIVDIDGLLSAIDAKLYPITLRCMGFEPAIVAVPTDTIVMMPATRELTELVVNSKDRPAMHIVCYIREKSSITDGIDSISITGQYMADFMLPAFEGAKCKTWDSPRELSRQIDYRKNGEDLKFDDSDMMSFYSIVSPFPKKGEEFPEALKGKTSGTATKNGKKGSETIYRLNEQTFTINSDALAGMPDHKFTIPAFLRLLGLAFDVNELWSQTVYSYNAEESYGPINLDASALSLKIRGYGKYFKKLLSNNQEVNICTYIEVFPVEISFLTQEEAKDIKKNRPVYPINPPSNAM